MLQTDPPRMFLDYSNILLMARCSLASNYSSHVSRNPEWHWFNRHGFFPFFAVLLTVCQLISAFINITNNIRSKVTTLKWGRISSVFSLGATSCGSSVNTRCEGSKSFAFSEQSVPSGCRLGPPCPVQSRLYNQTTAERFKLFLNSRPTFRQSSHTYVIKTHIFIFEAQLTFFSGWIHVDFWLNLELVFKRKEGKKKRTMGYLKLTANSTRKRCSPSWVALNIPAYLD